MSEIWVHTDEKEDAIAAMAMFAESSVRLLDDDKYWKWAIISLHNVFQSVMVIFLSVGDDFLVMRQEDAEAWLAAHENGAPYPETKMDSFMNLYGKLKKTARDSYKFKPRGQQGASIKKLNKFRNQFIHFMPMGWSIEMSGMPSICKDCLDIIKELEENFLCIRWDDDEQRKHFNRFFEQARENVVKVASAYKRLTAGSTGSLRVP
jgi:hypothetical protein